MVWRRRAASAASWVREERPSLANTWARWVWTVRREMNSRSPTWGLERPSATRSTTRRSVGVRLPQPSWGRRRGPRAPRRTPRRRRAASARAAGRAACGDHLEAAGPGVGQDLVEQAGLADAGRALERQQRPLAPLGGVERVRHRAQLG